MWIKRGGGARGGREERDINEKKKERYSPGFRGFKNKTITKKYNIEMSNFSGPE